MGKSPMKLNISNQISSLRAENKVTQEELTQAIEVTRATIGSIEKGKYNPSLELAFRISLFFKKNINEVFNIEGNHE